MYLKTKCKKLSDLLHFMTFEVKYNVLQIDCTHDFLFIETLDKINNIDFLSEVSTVHFVYTDEALLLVKQ